MEGERGVIDKDSKDSNYDNPVDGSIINPDKGCRKKSWFKEVDNEFSFGHANLYIPLVYQKCRKWKYRSGT